MCMKRHIAAAVLAVTVLPLAGCYTKDGEPVLTGRNVGTLLGAAAGGLLGAQVGQGDGRLAAVAAGTLIGAWLGGEVGESLNEDDRRKQAEATQDGLEDGVSGTTSSWVNPDTGASGGVTPQPAYTNAVGETCREFESEVVIGDETEVATGVACREPSGEWRIVS
ncbi:MAG: RT0821/Lpp0805 family surface protein [Pseudomonadota bacterium]